MLLHELNKEQNLPLLLKRGFQVNKQEEDAAVKLRD